MNNEKKFETDINSSQKTLFGFELNRSQASLFLIISLIAFFMLLFLLAQEIFLGLFQFIFDILPDYLSEPEIRPENYLIYHFWSLIIGMIISTIFLILSIYAIRKILRHNKIKPKNKRKIVHQDRMVNWFGLKISHGQSLFLFIISIYGILSLLELLLNHLISSDGLIGIYLLFESICTIPDGPNRATGHTMLYKNVPIAIMATFLLLCFYTLITTRRGKSLKASKKITKNYSLLIFIIFFVVLIFLSARIFCHLALFNPDVSAFLKISSNSTNKYQNNDFILTLVLFCICIAFMITSFFLKERNNKEMKASEKLSWLHIKLTPYRAITLLSSALLLTIFFTLKFLTFILIFGITYIIRDSIEISFQIILIAIILFCYYPIDKLLKNHHFDKFLENINNSGDFKSNWFKFRLDKTYSVILLSVGGVLMVFYIFQLIWVNLEAQMFYSMLDLPRETYLLFSFPILFACICLILIFIIYTIKKTFPSIKSRE